MVVLSPAARLWRWSDFARALGGQVPVIQAPMAGSATAALCVATSRAGGVGALALAYADEGTIVDECARVHAAVGDAFIANFFCHSKPQLDDGAFEAARGVVEPFYAELGLGTPQREADLNAAAQPFDEGKLAALLKRPPRAVTFHFGLPDDEALLAALHARGILIGSSATDVEEARHLAARGVDFIIAQGFEAGGHRGTFLDTDGGRDIGTLALVPQIVDAVREYNIPVVAAGGIADGRGVAAAMILGASAVQVGTVFLSCAESTCDDAYRRALRRAEAHETRLTRAFSGRRARGIAARYSRAADQAFEKMRLQGRPPSSATGGALPQKTMPDFPLLSQLSGPLRTVDGFAPHWAGQSVGLRRHKEAAPVVTARDLLEAIVAETDRALGLEDTRRGDEHHHSDECKGWS